MKEPTQQHFQLPARVPYGPCEDPFDPSPAPTLDSSVFHRSTTLAFRALSLASIAPRHVKTLSLWILRRRSRCKSAGGRMLLQVDMARRPFFLPVNAAVWKLSQPREP